MGAPARAITRSISDWLTLNGWHVSKNGSGCATNDRGQFFRVGGKDSVGRPDIEAHRVVISADAANPAIVRWLCIETKAGRDLVSTAQGIWLANAKKHGAQVIIAHSLQDVIDAIEPKT